MQLLPRFQIYDQGEQESGSFRLPEFNEDAETLLMEAEDHYYELEYQQSEKLLKKIIAEYPVYVDATILLARIANETRSPTDAINIIQKAAGLFEQVLPNDYQGELSWGFVENRPYLRLLHELMLFQDQNEQFEKAVSTGERILAYNPNDNQGIRWLMGDLYLRNENLVKAARFFKKTASEYPPNRYSYALLLMKQNKRWDAVTQFRLGFLENIYISELLRIKAPLVRYDVFEISNLNGIDVANDYILSMMDYWFQNMDALHMMNHLIGHLDVVAEINKVFGYLSDLVHLSVFDEPFDPYDDPDDEMNVQDLKSEARSEYFKEIEKIKKGVNSTSSKKILKDLDDLLSPG